MIIPGCGIFASNIARHLAFQMCQHVVMHIVHMGLHALLGSSRSLIRSPSHCSIVCELRSATRISSIPNLMARVQLHPKVMYSHVSFPTHIGHSSKIFGSLLRVRFWFTTIALCTPNPTPQSFRSSVVRLGVWE